VLEIARKRTQPPKDEEKLKGERTRRKTGGQRRERKKNVGVFFGDRRRSWNKCAAMIAKGGIKGERIGETAPTILR